MSTLVASESLLSSPPSDARFAETDYPALFIAADESARSSQKLYGWTTRLELGLLLLTSALIALEGASWIRGRDDGDYVRIAIAATLATVLIVKSAVRLRRFDSVWFESRGIAEGVKSLSWLYMMRVPPYDGDDAMALSELRQQMASLRRVYPLIESELHRLSVDQRQVTERMRAIRALGFPERRALYARARVDDQIDWYNRKARANKKQSTLWFVISIGVQLVALIAAIAQVGVEGLPFIQLTVAISIAVTALNRSSRNEDRSKEYGVAATELSLSLETLELTRNEDEFSGTVREIETIVGKEHSAWYSRRG